MNQLKIIEDCLQVMDNQDKTIETLQNALYKANYKHTQTLDEIAILNDTIKTLQKTIDNLSNELIESRSQPPLYDYYHNRFGQYCK